MIQSDQGREFVNEINTRLFQLTDIQHCVSSAYHPQTNGLDERFNQTLVNTLKKVIDSSTDDWDQHLSAALYAYRISKQVPSQNPDLPSQKPDIPRLASHSLFSDWTGAGEKGLVTLGYSFCKSGMLLNINVTCKLSNLF